MKSWKKARKPQGNDHSGVLVYPVNENGTRPKPKVVWWLALKRMFDKPEATKDIDSGRLL